MNRALVRESMRRRPTFWIGDIGCGRDRRAHLREATVSLGSRKCRSNMRAIVLGMRGPLNAVRDSSWKTRCGRRSGRAMRHDCSPQCETPLGYYAFVGLCTQGAPEYRRPWALELN